MKQILQSLKDGKTFIEELPTPSISPGCILVQTSHSLVSLGTEKLLVEFGNANIIEKVRQQPEKVKQVLDKIKADGLVPTVETIFKKLDEPIPLGYCNVGKVIAVGRGVNEFSIGDRVASNGPHAEIVSIRKNLAVKIPDLVSDEDAVFTVIGSIALQGIRLIKPSLGETVVVIGLGLIGLISCQLLRANGCKVIGIDIDANKCNIAKKLNFDTINSSTNDPAKIVQDITKQVGCDSVIIAASAKSDTVISQAARMSRKKGKIVLIGVIDLNLNRSDFYDKELSFQVSCSYGPGRYDSEYEQKGIDYPLPYVRWTEKRNFEAILESIALGNLQLSKLITDRFELNQFEKIYNNISSNKSIASILIYPNSSQQNISDKIIINRSPIKNSDGIIGIVGSGNFTKMTIIPSLVKCNAKIKTISSKNGLSGTLLAKKFKIKNSVTDNNHIFKDKDIDSVIIATRHNSHAKFVMESIRCNKNTFVEKPLAITLDELKEIKNLISGNENQAITVGYNRRFSPHLLKIKHFISSSSGISNIVATMNAGFIEKDHWIHDLNIGGGRILGEACHLIDACVFLAGSLVESVCMNALEKNPNGNTDNASILLKFRNGSNAVINYFSNGSKKYSKERFEVYDSGRTFIVDNFRKTTAFNVKNFKTLKTKIDKGHYNLFKNFVNYVTIGGDPIIPLDELFNVSEASFAAIESLKKREWVDLESL